MDVLSNTTHLHLFSWIVGVALFVITAVMAKGSKGRKITHMIARLFYVLILLSGFFLFMRYSSLDSALYGVKFLVGLIVIVLMEMIIVRANKGRNVSKLWMIFAIVLFVTLYLGFNLPVGLNFLA
ncbi:DUF1516 family protein [Sporosarcina pasteurii]|uniref:UPF0344 protein NCTC4822_00808 n=1 Tax=Sporosarcina pasteurii TaxID=1474 RepID=A0A380BF32_SPOPA|nr:YisL family protein [Sporosarcina pasteurii]QBQ05935.1 DUF1516 family protein [Sporosarcina pasteurii]SUI99869.1 Protein of uncharacterised function (DUF1516) [Sporosarcina pasteurii]